MRGHGSRVSLVLGLALSVIAVVLPASAAAVVYVDESGDDTANDCAVPQTPCSTISHAITQADALETVQVDSGNFAAVMLPGGRGLVAADFDGTAEPVPVIDAGAGTGVTVTNTGLAAGTVSGFTIRGDGASLRIDNDVIVENNTFDETNPASLVTNGADVHVMGTANATIRNNTFTDAPGSTDKQTGIFADGTGIVTINANTFQDLWQGVETTVQTSLDSNTITGLHEAPGALPGVGIVLTDDVFQVTRVHIHSAAPIGNPIGIELREVTPSPANQLTLALNRVFGQGTGVLINAVDGTVAMNSDILVNNSQNGLNASDGDGEAPTPRLPVTATNLTAFGNGTADIRATEVNLTLDSIIVGTVIDTSSGTVCSIAFSRGPGISMSPCGTFSTTADPGFVNPAANNFHLLLTSPLIDAGNPAPVGGFDVDGDPRQRDGNCDGLQRRDMGADEAGADCTPPNTTIDSGPSGTTQDRTPTFTFSSTEPGSAFQCSVDGAVFGPCNGPGASHTTGSLGGGQHSFAVQATDAAGNLDPTPAARAFTVQLRVRPRDTTRPDTSIKKGPKGRSTDRTPTFRFGSDEQGVTFRCRLDKQKFRRCARKVTRTVGLGHHVMRVVAVDQAGNRDKTPAKRAFTIVKKD